MHLTGLDFFFWAAGFLGHVSLLFVLFYRKQAKTLPFFSLLITLGAAQTIALYFVLHYGSKRGYLDTYWALTTVDTVLQLCVVYEIAANVFRPLDVWAADARRSFVWLLIVSLSVAGGLAWLASPPARTWLSTVTTAGNLFAAAWMSELFVAMMALAVTTRLPWKTHVAKIAQGLGTYSLVTVLIETGHCYFGGTREIPVFLVLSYVRMTTYLACVAYWIISLWHTDRHTRVMTDEMHEMLFTLQARLNYDLNDLRARK